MSVDGDVATGAEGTDPQQEKVLKYLKRVAVELTETKARLREH